MNAFTGTLMLHSDPCVRDIGEKLHDLDERVRAESQVPEDKYKEELNALILRSWAYPDPMVRTLLILSIEELRRVAEDAYADKSIWYKFRHLLESYRRK
jgi:hypothetical protein